MCISIRLALSLGIDRIDDFLGRFGLGRNTGIDVLEEKAGLLPSREWKRRARKQDWYQGETLITGIGQGYLLTTPLQLASATATLAMRGQRYAPRLLYATTGPRRRRAQTRAAGGASEGGRCYDRMPGSRSSTP